MSLILNDQKSEHRNVRASSIHSNRSSRKKKNNRKKKAKQWTYYIEALKSAIDCLYEICRREQSVSACKESLIYIQNAEKDFLSLITAINLELSFNELDKPQAVAWEVRKSISSSNQILNHEGAPALIDVLPMSPMIINDITLTSKKDGWNPDNHLDEGWQLVRGRRRKSASSTGTSEAFDNESRCSVDENIEKKPQSVYERLSANISSCRKHPSSSRPNTAMARSSSTRSTAARLTCPKSAMDLPQTKASMAKMAYCRQRIWEKDVQPSLAEKLKAHQKKERLQRETLPTKCGLNFVDPFAVRAQTKEFNEQKKQMRQKSAYSEGHRRSLQSICENVEGEDQDAVPSDPKPTAVQASKSDSPRLDRAVSSFTLNMEDDSEWGKMTEEEESLAMEEQSLNLEIEKAESELESIDAELARQVEDEAEQCRKANEDAMIFFPTGKGQYSQMVKKLEEDFKNFCHESWSELVEREFSGHYREPGTAAERHEKLCSPSRRRCDKDDNDLTQKHNEKQRRADEVREKMQCEKKLKLKELAWKREEVRMKRIDLTERKRAHLQIRMERAQENREKTLSQIVKKAKGDEQKVLEAQFIHNIQEENKRFDLMIRDAGIEERKQSMADLRAKKIEEKVAKEQAAEERRKKAEQERVTRLQELNERKEARHQRVTNERNLAEKERKDKRRLREQQGKEAKALALKNNLCTSWMNLVESEKWFELFNCAKVYKCRLCNAEGLSNIDSFLHVLNDKCGPSIIRTDTVLTTSAIGQHLDAALQLIQEHKNSVTNTEINLNLLDSNSKVLQSSLVINITGVVSSKTMKDFINLITKPTSRRTEDTTTKSIERALAEILPNAANKDNAQEFGLLLQFNVDDLLNYIVSWSINLRVLTKVTTLIVRLMESEAFALRSFCSDRLNDMCRLISSIKETPPQNLQLCSMLKIISACFEKLNKIDLKTFCLEEHSVVERCNFIRSALSNFCQNLKTCWTKSNLYDRSYIECLDALAFSTLSDLHSKMGKNRLPSDFYDLLIETALRKVKLWESHCEKGTELKTREETQFFISILGKTFMNEKAREELLQDSGRLIKLFCILFSLIRYSFSKSETQLTFQLDEYNFRTFNIVQQFASYSWSNQLLCQLEWRKTSILALLGSVSVQYIAEPKHSRITMPAYIAMTKSSFSATKLFSKTISLEYIISYLKDLISGTEEQLLLSNYENCLSFYTNMTKKLSITG
ncbi:unnamed protein product [Auanema sp. JU1783]|nr:unnamed protein product [Auanema sp. JU1783]